MSLRKSFLKGVKWSFLQQLFTQLINYVSVFWLAALITPEDFGKVALVVVLIGIFESVNGFGISQLIIRDNITDLKMVSTNFWLVFFLSTGLTLICIATGTVYSLLFQLSNIAEFSLVIVVSSISIILNGINSVFTALYSRDLNFKTPSKFFVLSLFIGNVVAVIVGHLGGGFWALIVKNIFPVAIMCVGYLILSRYRIQFFFSKALIKNTWSFASNFTYFNALNYLVRNLDYVVIGKFFDLATVGQYSIAYKIMVFPMKNVTSRIQTVLYPILVKLKDDWGRVERLYTLVVSGIAYLIFPVIVLVSSLANLWVPLFFDVTRYSMLIGLVQILSLVGSVQAITSPVGSLYLVSGNTQAMFRTGLVIALINSVGFFMGGASGNIYYFAFIYAGIQFFLSIPISNYIPFRLMKFDFLNFLLKIVVPFVAAVGSYFVILLVYPMVVLPVYLKLMLLGGIGMVAYIMFIYILSGGKIIVQLKQIRSIVIQK